MDGTPILDLLTLMDTTIAVKMVGHLRCLKGGMRKTVMLLGAVVMIMVGIAITGGQGRIFGQTAMVRVPKDEGRT